ncbi:MAG: hypothetical protein M3430_05950 [Acidobacteriota bacterium]|nr:hypothetical protein [Acidobacteriota bacterium]
MTEQKIHIKQAERLSGAIHLDSHVVRCNYVTHLDGKEICVRVGSRAERLEGAVLIRRISERTSPRAPSGSRRT